MTKRSMYRSNILFLAAVLFCTCTAYSQSLPVINLIKRADQAYEAFSYSEALNLYKNAFLRDTSDVSVHRKIALSYVKLNKSRDAEHWLKKYIDTSAKSDKEAYLLLVQQLLKNKKYSEAGNWLDSLSHRQLAAAYRESIQRVPEFLKDSLSYTLLEVKHNQYASDFGPMYYDDKVAFLSSRSTKKWIKRTFNWDESAYLDFYVTSTNDSSQVVRLKGLNSSFHEGPGQLFLDSTKIVFTRNNISSNRVLRDQKGVNRLQIYFAERDSAKNWLTAKPYQYNHKDYSLGHPTITEDGKTMIFASDMPGGFGRTDLYISRRLPDSTWSEPANLGDHINTAGDELFPFISKDGLYFASNGWPGLGGLDIFYSEDYTQGSQVPFNLRSPLNSEQDDFSLITNSDLQTGFFSSDRSGSDDIYAFESKTQPYSGYVFDYQSKAPITDAQVYIINESGDTLISKIKTDAKGKYAFKTLLSEPVTVQAAKSGMVLFQPIYLGASHDKMELEQLLMYEPKLIVTIIDEKTKQPLKDIQFQISESGKQLSSISQQSLMYDLLPNKHYMLIAASEGYYTHRDSLITASTLQPETKKVITMKKIVIGESIRLENIYYDVNSADLRTESEKELDKLVTFMQDNSHIKIELSSHTDSRGSAAYNKKLSQRRAESATKYLVGHGIDSERIVPKGYGEEKVANECKDGVACSKEKHQENRRTEIKILKN